MSGSPTVYLATSGDGRIQRQDVHPERPPALLVSYVYLQGWEDPVNRTANYSTWCMDSGAFSAWNIGKAVSQEDYVSLAARVWAADPRLDHVFALDVIDGSWRDTLANTEGMWRAGVPAVPCFHFGEPWDVLRGMARDYPKVALGGMVPLRRKEKQRFAEECFMRVWPKALHGFGVGSRDLILEFPWHSIDASSWEVGPCRFGRWKSFNGGTTLRARGEDVFQKLAHEIEYYAAVEDMAQHRWTREMGELRDQLTAANWRRP